MNIDIRTIHRTTNMPTIAALLLATVTVATIAVPTSRSAASEENPHDILIVANLATKVNVISVEELRECFLKIKKTWPDGSRLIPINSTQPELRNLFRQRVLMMSAEDEQRYWQDQLIRNGEHAPPTFSNTLKVAFSLPGTVSYVFRKDFLPNVVKVVAVIPAK